MTFEQIVRSHRAKQLAWTRDSVRRIDTILQNAARDTLARLKEIAGTGKIEERYRSALLSDLMRTLDQFKADYSELMNLHLLGSSQVAAARELQIAEKLFSGADLEEMTKGLRPEFERSAKIANIGEITVTFGQVAEHAVNIEFARVYQDGLTLSDRLWRLDNTTRTAMQDKIVGAIAQGTSARDLARDLRQYLTEAGQGNARYNATRLTRTEINTAHREAHIQSTLDASGNLKTFIQAIGWRLSASHPRPDICDVWASQNINSLGSGNYLPQSVPIDHAHGLCHTVTLLKAHPDMQFVTKEADPSNVSPAQLKTYGIEATP